MDKQIDKDGIDNFGKDNPYIGIEDNFQIAVAYFLDMDKRTRHDWHHTPNGGKRNKKEAVKLKRMGTKEGVPDCAILVAYGLYHGLFIELKVKRPSGSFGTLQDSQKTRIKRLTERGYYSCVCWSIDAVMYVVDQYFADQKQLKAT